MTPARDQTANSELPTLVRRYVERNVPSESLPSRVQLTQVGEMQLKPGRWTRFTATQSVAVERVEFSWRARFPIIPPLALRVDDWYRANEGALEVRLLGLPLKRVRGLEVTKGEAMRYLAELAWAPQAMLGNRELDWRAVDEATVEVATRVAGAQVAVLLHFDGSGDIVASSAEARPRTVGSAAIDTPFRGDCGEYAEFDGVRLPTTATATWELPDGPFTYYRGRVTAYTPE